MNQAELVLKIAEEIPADPYEILYWNKLTAKTPHIPPSIMYQKSAKLIIISPWPSAVLTDRQIVPIIPSISKIAKPTYLPSAPLIARVLEAMISVDRQKVASVLSDRTTKI